jgi:hypothetical protein
MSTQHTNGPWKLLEVGENKRFCPADKDNQSILTIEEEGRSLFACVYEEADARLIAAAPELLEALKNMLPENNRLDEHFRPTFATCEEARAAIAKAEGGSA